jgi:hypothetical protein
VRCRPFCAPHPRVMLRHRRSTSANLSTAVLRYVLPRPRSAIVVLCVRPPTHAHVRTQDWDVGGSFVRHPVIALQVAFPDTYVAGYISWYDTPFSIFEPPGEGVCLRTRAHKKYISLEGDEMDLALADCGVFDLHPKATWISRTHCWSLISASNEKVGGKRARAEELMEMDETAKEEFAKDVRQWLNDLSDETTEIIPMGSLSNVEGADVVFRACFTE